MKQRTYLVLFLMLAACVRPALATCGFTSITNGALGFNAGYTVAGSELGSGARAALQTSVTGTSATLLLSVPTLSVAGVSQTLSGAEVAQLWTSAAQGSGTSYWNTTITTGYSIPVNTATTHYISVTLPKATGVYSAAGAYSANVTATCI